MENTNPNEEKNLNINLIINGNRINWNELQIDNENVVNNNEIQRDQDLKENLLENLNINEQEMKKNINSTEMDHPRQEIISEEALNSNTSNSLINSDAKLKFYENLRTVIKTQENILNLTGMASEKIKYANEISLDQLNTFQENSQKYGKYLKMIHEELQMIGDLMKKIKKDVKNQ